ncbi:MAG: peptide chain release factor N(5)-glutamine methyltransferase [Flavobacteriales bacterium]|nr:peptide chain release factor N(5)-glutamine methyltransferase [Flavobacteriales bacterium]
MQVQDNRLSSFKSFFEKYLKGTEYASSELRPLFRRLSEDLLGLEPSQILLADDTLLTESQILKLLSATKELKKGRPIQYIIGHTEFSELKIKCDQRALIPRPETEELVRWITESHRSISSAIDIGTGTACIALALKNHFTSAQIAAMDSESDALELAEENSRLLDLEIELVLDDITEPRHEYGQYQIIVSNPPYVRASESNDMRANVLDHEPHSALFVEDEVPLQFYRAILEFASDHLRPSGWTYFEINENLGKEMADLLAQFGYSEIELRKDLYGKDRMIRGTLLKR